MKVRTGKGELGEDPEMSVCWRREDLGKIQGRSIDLGEYGVWECWGREDSEGMRTRMRMRMRMRTRTRMRMRIMPRRMRRRTRRRTRITVRRRRTRRGTGFRKASQSPKGNRASRIQDLPNLIHPNLSRRKRASNT